MIGELIRLDRLTPDFRIGVAAVLAGTVGLAMIAASFVVMLGFHEDVPGLRNWMQLLLGSLVLVAGARGGPLAISELRAGRRFAASALESRRQVEQLFKMTDMLQSASGYSDADAVLRATASALLPGLGGALYVFNNSRDRLDLSTMWDWSGTLPAADCVVPNQCWALKRGKPHINHDGPAALRCEHHGADLIVLEIPMMARGDVFGLLLVQASGDMAEERLVAIEPLAGAIADAMSLALSNLALREKLRTQALRDPLTGLYNRRYMEDVLERYANLAERNGSAVSAIMIDLDHFKQLNDENGHAMGDAVLREVAASIVGAIRPSDVACRYGGEELVVLLADCGVEEATLKAELLRGRIESLSDVHGVRVTASFGVATTPDLLPPGADIIAAADSALYRAKQAGRNRVEVAAGRNSGGHRGPLAVAAE